MAIDRKTILSRLPKAQRRWYDIKNATGDVAEIRIYDEVSWWGLSAEDFAADLQTITAAEIIVAINCPGGDVFDGIAIYNALRAHPAKITTRVDGVAASVASVIVQAGDTRVMMSGSQIMVHEPWGIVVGSAQEMREAADLVDRQADVLASIYAERSGKTEKHFRDLMAEHIDNWFTAQEAIDEGLADEILKPAAAGSKDAPAASAASALKTFHDEIREAMDVVSVTIESAERVAALRAEKGKQLSGVNREGLDELAASMDRLKALLAAEPEPETHPDGTTSDDLAREWTRFVRTTSGV